MGEAISPEGDHPLHDTLTVPDLASAEASFERSRLLLASGPNVAAMGIDASNTIQAQNSLEKMLAHQLAGAAYFPHSCYLQTAIPATTKISLI